MNRINFILLISLLLLFIVKSGHSQKTKWQSDKYNIPEKLSRLEFLYDSQGKLFYLLTNDKDNLYVHIRAADETAQKKLIIYGFTIEVKTKGPNKKKLTIEYPLPKKDRMEPIVLLPDNSHGKRSNFNLTKGQVVKQLGEMRITGLSDKKRSITIAANDKSNINGNMTIYKNGELEYLLVIPLNSLGINLSENLPINIKMMSGSLDVLSASSSQPRGGTEMSSRPGGGRSQGMGGQRGGGRGQGSGGRGASPANKEQRMGERQALTTSIKITVKKLMLINENN